MIEDAHEQHQVEALPQLRYFVDGQVTKLDVKPEHFDCEARLREIDFVVIDAEYTAGAAALHLDGIKAAVAADVENGFSGEIGG